MTVKKIVLNKYCKKNTNKEIKLKILVKISVKKIVVKNPVLKILLKKLNLVKQSSKNCSWKIIGKKNSKK